MYSVTSTYWKGKWVLEPDWKLIEIESSLFPPPISPKKADIYQHKASWHCPGDFNEQCRLNFYNQFVTCGTKRYLMKRWNPSIPAPPFRLESQSKTI